MTAAQTKYNRTAKARAAVARYARTPKGRLAREKIRLRGAIKRARTERTRVVLRLAEALLGWV